MFNPFPNDKPETFPNREALQTAILSLVNMEKSSLKGVEITDGKGEIARSLQAICPFLIVFLKDLCCRHVKTRACLGKG